MKSYFIVVFLLSIFSGFGQNLVPNSGFEARKTCRLNIENAFLDDAGPWYVAGGTPDLLQKDCPVELYWETDDFPNYQPSVSGDAAAYIAGGAGRGGGFATEAIGVSLLSPLEADIEYLFVASTLATRFDVINGGLCTDPLHALLVHLGTDSAVVTTVEQNQIFINSSINAEQALIFEGPAVTANNTIAQDALYTWRRVAGCLVAVGGERHLSFTHNLGRFDSFGPPCERSPTADGLNNLHGLHLDDVGLYRIPDAIALLDTICENSPYAVALEELVPAPFGELAAFTWEDGEEGSTRTLTKAGRYAITATVDCAEIPIELELVDGACAGQFVAANAFTPNFDGINDRWGLLLRTEFPVSEFSMTITDRYGRVVHTGSDLDKGWDGTDNGRILPGGVYVWQAVATLDTRGQQTIVSEKGTLLLVR